MLDPVIQSNISFKSRLNLGKSKSNGYENQAIIPSNSLDGLDELSIAQNVCLDFKRRSSRKSAVIPKDSTSKPKMKLKETVSLGSTLNGTLTRIRNASKKSDKVNSLKYVNLLQDNGKTDSSTPNLNSSISENLIEQAECQSNPDISRNTSLACTLSFNDNRSVVSNFKNSSSDQPSHQFNYKVSTCITPYFNSIKSRKKSLIKHTSLIPKRSSVSNSLEMSEPIDINSLHISQFCQSALGTDLERITSDLHIKNDGKKVYNSLKQPELGESHKNSRKSSSGGDVDSGLAGTLSTSIKTKLKKSFSGGKNLTYNSFGSKKINMGKNLSKKMKVIKSKSLGYVGSTSQNQNTANKTRSINHPQINSTSSSSNIFISSKSTHSARFQATKFRKCEKCGSNSVDLLNFTPTKLFSSCQGET